MGEKFKRIEVEVYIIIVNHNTTGDTIECIESVLKPTEINFKIIVVDNSDNDENVKQLENWAIGESHLTVSTLYPDLVFPLQPKPLDFASYTEQEFTHLELNQLKKVTIIKADKNNGFAAANNIVLNYFIKNDEGKNLFWLLNNDTVITANALSQILEFFNKNNQSGLLGTSLMEYTKQDKVQSFGGVYFPFWAKLSIPRTWTDFKKARGIKYPNGASMVVTSDFLKSVGPMSEDYFLYFEETDWTLRGKANGFAPMFLNASVVFHKGGTSTGKNSILADYYYTRAKLLITKKYYSTYLLHISVLICMVFPINRLLKRQLDRTRLLIPIFKDVFLTQKKLNL